MCEALIPAKPFLALQAAQLGLYKPLSHFLNLYPGGFLFFSGLLCIVVLLNCCRLTTYCRPSH